MRKLHGEIILVDDDEFELNFLKETLSNLSYEATIKYFNNARDGYGYIKETNNNIFLIICDIQMHPISGFKLKETIENDPEVKAKAIPFVFATTYATEENIELAYKYNIQGFFEKPTTPNKMVDFLSVIIQYWVINQHPNKNKHVYDGHTEIPL
ncbi:MAG: histidine kinase [Flavipsychrobacter sp.]|nr:histidine kinase [Flavipsychrobacter sp.]